MLSLVLATGVYHSVAQYRRAKRLTPDRPSFGRRLLNVPRAFFKCWDRFLNPHGVGPRPDGVPEPFSSKKDEVLVIREPRRTLLTVPKRNSRNVPGGLFGTQAKENYFEAREAIISASDMWRRSGMFVSELAVDLGDDLPQLIVTLKRPRKMPTALWRSL